MAFQGAMGWDQTSSMVLAAKDQAEQPCSLPLPTLGGGQQQDLGTGLTGREVGSVHGPLLDVGVQSYWSLRNQAKLSVGLSPWSKK